VLSLLEPKDDHAREVRSVFETRCREDRWPEDIRICVVATASLKDPRHCKAKLAPALRAHLETDLAAAAVRARDRTVPESCRAYARTIDKIMTCDAIPQAARDAMHQGYEALRQSWTNQDEDSRDDGCRAAADALRQAASSMGCDLL